MYCTENSKIDKKMDGVEVIDLCSASWTKNGEQDKGKESTKQESQDKIKTNTIIRMKDKNRPRKGNPTTENEENETAMMCWEALNDSLKKEPRKESDKEGEKPIKKMQQQKDEEEHVEPTLNTGNRQLGDRRQWIHTRFTRNRTTTISVHHESHGWFTKGQYEIV